MGLPSRARVEAAPRFLACLREAEVFFAEQDGQSAPERVRQLKAALRTMVEVMAWAPASGRPARFLEARSARAMVLAQSVLGLARQTGLPHLREHVLGQHVVLYAHPDAVVVLLALMHQRQLGYPDPDTPKG